MNNPYTVGVADDGMVWELLHPRMTIAALGELPAFFTLRDPRPAREQIAENYCSGWHPVPGLELLPSNVLTFPGDPPFEPLAQARLRDELLVFYHHALFAIIQPDRTFEVGRVD